ncbi:MAG: DUF4440 domain-containing protein [Betaproteobacteria bacterium]|nr:MAG: DUF4440 domain-containing protein [Betaproteobacteria bacterium]
MIYLSACSAQQRRPLRLTCIAAALSLLAVSSVAWSQAQAQAPGADLQDINRLLKAGQSQQALDKVNTYLSSKPKDPVARFMRGLAQSETGRTNDAIMTFQSLTEDFPELPEPYNNLAVLYSSKGQFEKARVALELAIQTHPTYSTAHENLGDIYAKLASQAYDKALQIDKANSGAATKLNLVRDLFSTNPKANTAPRAAAAVLPVAAPAVAAKAATPPLAAAPTAATPAPAAPSPAPAAANGAAEVSSAVNKWSKAWSEQNVAAYLSSYAKSFKPEGGQSRADWVNARTERVKAPSKISVKISEEQIEMLNGNEARVTFRQQYSSDSLQTRSRKTLSLVREDGVWRITRERSG